LAPLKSDAAPAAARQLAAPRLPILRRTRQGGYVISALGALLWIGTLGTQAGIADADSARMARDSTASTVEAPVPLIGPRRSLTRVAASREALSRGRVISSEDSATQRRRAVEHSDWYYKRLAIHKAASFATAPLFVAEYLVGDKLFDDDDSSGNLKSTHQALATGIGVLFGVNTVTGVWNLWDSRHETQGRARRFTHAALMLASDAGFVATASLAPEGDDRDEGERGEDGSNGRNRHRTVAITSMSVSLASYLMMYFWK
jgi:hypothetical protein